MPSVACIGPFTSISNEVKTEIIELFITKETCRYSLKGRDICFFVTATNPSQVDIYDILFSDKLDDRLEYVPFTFQVGDEFVMPMMAGNTIQFPLDIKSGETVEIRFCARVRQGQPQQ